MADSGRRGSGTSCAEGREETVVVVSSVVLAGLEGAADGELRLAGAMKVLVVVRLTAPSAP